MSINKRLNPQKKTKKQKCAQEQPIITEIIVVMITLLITIIVITIMIMMTMIKLITIMIIIMTIMIIKPIIIENTLLTKKEVLKCAQEQPSVIASTTEGRKKHVNVGISRF